MRIAFVGIDPGTEDDHCPAVFMDEDTGRLVLIAKRITDPQDVAQLNVHAPLGGGVPRTEYVPAAVGLLVF